MRRVGATSILAAAVLWALPARAEVEHVQLEYRAPEACPSQSAFEAEIRARTAKVVIGETGRRFVVTLEQGEAAWIGMLVIADEDGGQNERTLDGAACEDVVSGLALVAALAIDPEASTAPRAELVLQAPAATELEPERPAPSEPVAPPPAPPPEEPRSRAAGPISSGQASWEVGLGAAVLTGPAPGALFAAGPELRFVRPTSLGDSSLGLALFAAETGVVGPDVADARFRFLAGRLDACPFARDRALRWRLCAAFVGGAIRAEGREIDVPQAQTRAFAAGGAHAALGYALGPRFYADLEASALANLTRDDFVFENPRVSVHEVPFGSFFAGLALGAKIP